MKKLLKISVLILAAVLMFGLVGCPGGEEDDDTVEWTNFTGTERSISVTNNTSERLVAFKGTPSVHTLISGIPGNASNHGLKKGTAINNTEDFSLVLVRESVFNAKRSDLSQITVDDYFATIYAFYNTQISNDTVFQISSFAGGEGELVIINMTSWNVELREGEAHGHTLGFVRQSNPRAVIRLEMPEDYYFFPVFRRMHPITGEIIAVTPRFNEEGPLKGQPFYTQMGFSSAHRVQAYNIADVIGDQIPSMSLGGSWIRVRNMNTGTGIQFQQGGTEFLTTHGVRTIPAAYDANYQIGFSPNTDGQFPPTYTINGVQVGTGGSPLQLGNVTFDLDTEYEIRVGGTNANNLYIIPVTAEEAEDNHLWAEGDLIRKIGAIDVEAFFNQFD